MHNLLGPMDLLSVAFHKRTAAAPRNAGVAHPPAAFPSASGADAATHDSKVLQRRYFSPHSLAADDVRRGQCTGGRADGRRAHDTKAAPPASLVAAGISSIEKAAPRVKNQQGGMAVVAVAAAAESSVSDRCAAPILYQNNPYVAVHMEPYADAELYRGNGAAAHAAPFTTATTAEDGERQGVPSASFLSSTSSCQIRVRRVFSQSCRSSLTLPSTLLVRTTVSDDHLQSPQWSPLPTAITPITLDIEAGARGSPSLSSSTAAVAAGAAVTMPSRGSCQSKANSCFISHHHDPMQYSRSPVLLHGTAKPSTDGAHLTSGSTSGTSTASFLDLTRSATSDTGGTESLPPDIATETHCVSAGYRVLPSAGKPPPYSTAKMVPAAPAPLWRLPSGEAVAGGPAATVPACDALKMGRGGGTLPTHQHDEEEEGSVVDQEDAKLPADCRDSATASASKTKKKRRSRRGHKVKRLGDLPPSPEMKFLPPPPPSLRLANIPQITTAAAGGGVVAQRPGPRVPFERYVELLHRWMGRITAIEPSLQQLLGKPSGNNNSSASSSPYGASSEDKLWFYCRGEELTLCPRPEQYFTLADSSVGATAAADVAMTSLSAASLAVATVSSLTASSHLCPDDDTGHSSATSGAFSAEDVDGAVQWARSVSAWWMQHIQPLTSQPRFSVLASPTLPPQPMLAPQAANTAAAVLSPPHGPAEHVTPSMQGSRPSVLYTAAGTGGWGDRPSFSPDPLASPLTSFSLASPHSCCISTSSLRHSTSLRI